MSLGHNDSNRENSEFRHCGCKSTVNLGQCESEQYSKFRSG